MVEQFQFFKENILIFKPCTYALLYMQLALMSQERSWFHHDSSPHFQIMAYVLIVLFHVGDPEHRREHDTWRFFFWWKMLFRRGAFIEARSYRLIDEIYFDALAVKDHKFDFPKKQKHQGSHMKLNCCYWIWFWISILTVAWKQAVAKSKTNKIQHMKKKSNWNSSKAEE